MRRSHYRRASKWPTWLSGRRRIVAAAATLVAFGAIVGVTQVSNASTETKKALAACDSIQAPKASKLSTETKKGTYTSSNGKVTQHSDDGASDVPTAAQMRTRCRDWVMQNAGNSSAAPAASTKAADPAAGAVTPPPGAGLGILANSCKDSKLTPHTGFQIAPACVSTEFGELAAQQDNPSLLITEAPEQIGVNTPFTIKVSTRNLIRDRFLAAGAGGYYVESSVLKDGIVRGHFHTACRMLANTNEAPAPDPVPAFFVATEDSKGNRTPDVVSIQVPGLPTAGIAQCASWAGDGSHRIPMMQRANQTPAFDAVRINVTGGAGDNNGGGQNNGGQNNGGNNGGGASTPPATPPTTAPTTAAPANNGGGGAANGNGNTGGNNNGGNNGTKGQPTTKTTIVQEAPTTAPATRPATAATTKPATTTNSGTTTKSGTTKSGTTNSGSTSSGGGDEQPATVETTKAAPKVARTAAPAKSSEAATGDYTYSNDDGAPDANQADTTVAEPPATAANGGSKLALTGFNTVAVVGGGVVLVLIGLVALSSTRRRRSRSGGGWN